MENHGELAFVCLALLYCLGAAATNETNCAELNFDGLDVIDREHVVYIREHSNQSIDFKIVNRSCSTLKNEVLRVEFTEVGAEAPLTQCVIRNLKDHSTGMEPCLCRNYSCSVKIFTRNDSGLWEFRSDTGKIREAKITVNVTYPARLTKFRLGGSEINPLEVERDIPVQALCFWEQGNPRRSVFIEKRMAESGYKSLHQDETPPHAQYTVSNSTQCSDSGHYRCHVGGTNESRAVTLLVKCPLEFQAFENEPPEKEVAIPGENVTFEFFASSYKNETRDCKLTPPNDNDDQRRCNTDKSKREVTVSGTPPDVVVTVVVRNVTQDDEGTWQLALDNGQGLSKTSKINFTITLAPSKSEDDMWKELMIISCVVATAALILCITITVCVCRSRKKTKGKEKSSMKAEAFGSQDPLALHGPKEDCGMIVNEIYSSSDPRGDSFMITNDFYEGSGVTPTGAASPRATGYEEVNMDTEKGTVTMTTAKATESSTGDYANVADVQKTKKDDKDRKRKQPKGSAPGPPVSKDTSAGTDGAKKNKKELKDKEAPPKKGKTQTNSADSKANNSGGEPAKGSNPGKDSDNAKKEATAKENGKPTSTENATTDTNAKLSTTDVGKKNSSDLAAAKANAPKTKADASVARPDPPKTKTDASKTKPDATKTKPDAAKSKPEATKTKPDATKTKPDATKTKPDAAKSKPEATKTKAEAANPKAEGAAGNDDQREILVDARVPNAEGCLYGQLDFSKITPRTTVIKDLPSTDYAEIDFKASPPPAPKE